MSLLLANLKAKRSAAPGRGQGLRAGGSVQFLRYAIVGLASNAALYLLYLAFTSIGFGPKTVMTVLFATGVLMTFLVNHSWSFQSTARRRTTILKYVAVYAIGYVINWLGLWLLVEELGYSHQWVQLAMIALVAGFLFVNLRLWVFR